MNRANRQPPAALRIPEAIVRAVIAHLAAAAPSEGVGLLATAPAVDGERVVRFYPGRNIDASATRYTMDPAQVVAAFDEMGRHGWRFGAIVHSHPASAATPSATDLREAFYPDVLMVIVDLRQTPPEVRAWWVGGGGPVEVPVVVDPLARE